MHLGSQTQPQTITSSLPLSGPQEESAHSWWHQTHEVRELFSSSTLTDKILCVGLPLNHGRQKISNRVHLSTVPPGSHLCNDLMWRAKNPKSPRRTHKAEASYTKQNITPTHPTHMSSIVSQPSDLSGTSVSWHRHRFNCRCLWGVSVYPNTM